jgi:hypothetical protein
MLGFKETDFDTLRHIMLTAHFMSKRVVFPSGVPRGWGLTMWLCKCGSKKRSHIRTASTVAAQLFPKPN